MNVSHGFIMMLLFWLGSLMAQEEPLVLDILICGHHEFDDTPKRPEPLYSIPKHAFELKLEYSRSLSIRQNFALEMVESLQDTPH